MAIVPLVKVTLFGPLADKERALAQLQSAGCIHIVSLRPETIAKGPTPEIAVGAHEAIKYLQASPIQRPKVTRETDYSFEPVVKEVLALRDRDRALQDERDRLRKAIDLVRPLGHFQVPPADEIGGLHLWFYLVPASRENDLREAGFPAEIVARNQKQIWAVILAPTEPVGVPGTKLELDPRPLVELEASHDRVTADLESVALERARLSRWIGNLRRGLAEADDHASLAHAMKQTYDDDRLFAVQGWAPVDDETKVRRVADDMGLALTVEQPADDELPPTLLKNPEFLAGGQQAVTFYLTPGYRWWDPSLVVLFSFALFFAMIISDAGYSALLGLVLAIFWRPLGKTVDGRRLRHMTLVLVGFALTWGVIVGSYFGLAPPKDSFLGRLVFIDTTNLNQMMMLSILIGASHLMLANAITAWRSVGTLKGLVPIGWIVSIIGGLLYGMASYDQIARVWETVGQWMLIIGLPTALLLNSDQPFPPRSIWHVLGRLGDGVKNLMAVSAAFGDTLSYLRLFALGLSGAQLASTFNKLAADSVESFGGIGLVLGVVIIVVGHSLNFVLGIMGGVIHGLRLNCIEFFNWCSTDEGYPFGAFSKKADH